MPWDPWNQPNEWEAGADLPIVRVEKICRWDHKGRVLGCGKVWEGWQWADGTRIPAASALRRTIVEESGEVWGVCDSCAERLESAYQRRVREAQTTAPTSLKKMRPPPSIEERYDL